MLPQTEKTVSATEFKAQCLDLMEQVHSGRLRRVRITKRGKPFVAVEPDAAAEKWSAESMFGCMKDWPSPVPPDQDWTQPLFSDAELDGFVQSTVDQIDELARRPRD